MDLMESLMISAAGMRAQGQRLRVVAENLANADSVSELAGGDTNRRKNNNNTGVCPDQGPSHPTRSLLVQHPQPDRQHHHPPEEERVNQRKQTGNR